MIIVLTLTLVWCALVLVASVSVLRVGASRDEQFHAAFRKHIAK